MLYRVDCKGLLPLITADYAQAMRAYLALYRITGRTSMRALTRRDINRMNSLRRF